MASGRASHEGSIQASGGVTPFGEADSADSVEDDIGYGKSRVAATMNQIGMGLAQFETLLLAGGVFLMEGCLLVIASIVVRTLELRWGNSMFETTMLATSMFLGVSLGCMTGGLIADRDGRRPAILVCYCGSAIFVLLSAGGMNLIYLVFSNMCLGFFFGYGVPAANSLIAECCPTSFRPNLVCSAAIMFAMGQMVAGIIVWCVSPYLEYEKLNWRILSAAGCVPIMFFAPLAYLRLSESPMWLWVSGSPKRAKEALRLLASRNGVTLGADRRKRSESHLYVVQSDEDQENNEMDGRQGIYERVMSLFIPRYRTTTIMLVIIAFASNFCYYGMIYVLPETFAELMLLLEEDPDTEKGLHLSPALSLMLSALFEIPGVLLALMLTNTVRRKTALTISFSILSIAAIAMVSASAHRKHAVVLTSLAAFLGKLFVAAAFILVYLYIVEVYPTSVRSSGLAFCMTMGRLGAFVVPLTAELSMHLANTSFYFFAVLGIAGGVAAVACLFVPLEPDVQAPQKVDEEAVSLIGGSRRSKDAPSRRESRVNSGEDLLSRIPEK